MSVSIVQVKDRMRKREEISGRSILWSISTDMKDLVRWIEGDFQVDQDKAKKIAIDLVKTLLPEN